MTYLNSPSPKAWDRSGRTAKELYQYIIGLEHLLKREQLAGKKKLKNTISQIKASSAFCDFPVVWLPPKGEAVFIGDTHGDSLAVQAIVRQENFIEKVRAGQDIYLVFLGDYADRGLADIKNLEIILGLKQYFPHRIFLLRGNHEEVNVSQYYGLLGSCLKKFGYDDGQQIFREFNDLFEKLPTVAVTANGVVAVHGGVPVSPVSSLRDLQDEENAVEMRWNDPTEEIEHYTFNYKRGGYFLFGEKVFTNFMTAIGGRVLVRSHEYVANGSKLMFNGQLLTIFSNGGQSPESGYRDFILHPKYAKVDLSKPIGEWSEKNVFDIKY